MMARRKFIGSTLVAGAVAGAVTEPARGQAGKTRGKSNAEYYELRTIHLRIGAQGKLVNDFLSEVYLPALNRLGVKPVGVFNLKFGPDVPTLYMLTPFESLAAFEKVQEKLPGEIDKDKDKPAAQAYLGAPGATPPYVRMESQLLQAFDSIPKLEIPEKKPRIFELRTYENPTEAGHAKKMAMFFPKLGELELFRRVGLQPVFFGRTIIGPRLPNFVYMLTFPDLAAREKNWAAFIGDPEWQKLKAMPGYGDSDIMSNITDLVLTPAGYSQI